MDDRDESTKVAMIVIGIIVTAVVAFVLAIGAGAGARSSAGARDAVTAAPDEMLAPVGDALLKIYFDVGKAELSADSAAALKRVEEAAMAHPALIVLVSGFHDPSGDAIKNAELARHRAMVARDALVAAGVPAERIKLRKPEVTEGTGDAAEARRVEFRVQ